MADQLTNPQGLTVQQMSAAAANPQQANLNPQGLTAQQMGQAAEDQMKTSTIQQSQAQPGVLTTGGQLGATPTGQLPQQPITFQAQTITPEQQRAAGIQEVARLNNISLDQAAQRYDAATNRPTNLPPGTVFNPATGQVTDPRTGNVYAGSTGQDFQGMRFVDPQVAAQMGLTGLPSGTPGGQNQLSGGVSGPTGVSTPSGAPGSLDEQLAKITEQTDQAFNTYQQSMKQLQSGTFPLTPEQNAQVQAMQSQIDQMKQAQIAANDRYTRGMTQAGISSGRARYAPEIELGNIQNTINSGLSKIRDIEIQGMQAMTDLKKGFETSDYQMINDQYDRLTSALEKKSVTISSMQKAINDHQEKMIELQQKAEQQEFENTLKSADFDQKAKQLAFDQAMQSDKMDWSKKQDMVKNMMDSDKFTWQQKQDNIKNALDQGKFSYEQEKDLRNYQLDLQKLESSDTPASYKEWKLSGQPSSYSDWLTQSKINSKPPTQDQSQTATLVTNAKAGNDTIKAMGDYLKNLSYADFEAQKRLPNFLQNSEFQRFKQGAQSFAEAWLRKTSGAAISDSEWKNVFNEFIPQPGDKPEVVAQKEQARQGVLRGMANEAGPALSDDFKSTLDNGKLTFHSLDEFAQANPDKRDAIDKIGQEHPNWSDDDVLQILQSDQGGGTEQGFNMGLSTPLKGSLSLSFESSGNPGAVGYDSTGGYSYGLFQLAHDNAKNFIDQSKYAGDFSGLKFNSPAWQNKWKEIAQKDPQGFADAQTNYITQTHVDPQIQKLEDAGLKIDQYSPALKEVLFSTAVQHGPNTNVVLDAFKRLPSNPSEENLIKAIYKARWGGGSQFARSTPAVRRSVYNRFFGQNGEMNKALALAKQYNA